MQFQLNFKSGKPVYLQVVDQVKAAVASGAARAGDILPSIRPLAEELRVNRNTVAKAYTELESQGVIETIVGQGLFHRRRQPSPLRKDAPHELLTEDIDEAVVQAHHLQVDKAEFLRLAEDRFDSFAKRRARALEWMMPMAHDAPAIEITDLVRRFGRTDAVNGLSLRVRARPLLRLLRPQRRRQDDDDQVPAQSAAANGRQRVASSA